MQTSSHGEMRTSTAAAPAAARTTKSNAIVTTSAMTTRFSANVYATWRNAKRSRNPAKYGPSCPARKIAAAADIAASQTAPRCERAPLAIGRRRFFGCSRSAGRVAEVVHHIGGARGRAEGGEGDERPQQRHRIPQLGGEDDPGEEEDVLHPLARARSGHPDAGTREDSPRGQGSCQGLVNRGQALLMSTLAASSESLVRGTRLLRYRWGCCSPGRCGCSRASGRRGPATGTTSRPGARFSSVGTASTSSRAIPSCTWGRSASSPPRR